MMKLNFYWYKKAFVVCFVALLFVPSLYILGIKDKTELYGVEEIGKVQNFEWKTFETKTFQNNFENYWNTHFGFRKFMLKTKNTLYDWLNFRYIHKGYFEAIIEGKNRYLFGNYLFKSVYKYCFPVPNMEKLSLFNEYAKKHGIEVYFVLAPSKALTYYEYLPERYKYFLGKDCHIYQNLTDKITELKVPVYNSQPLIEKIHRNSGPEPFPIGGIHWNLYGAGMVLKDSFKSFGLGELNVKRIDARKHPYYSEQDLTKLQNVFFTKHNDKVFYRPVIEADFKLDGITVVVGDSYSNEYYLSLKNAKVVKDGHLLHYGNEPLNDERAAKILQSNRVIFVYTDDIIDYNHQFYKKIDFLVEFINKQPIQ